METLTSAQKILKVKQNIAKMGAKKVAQIITRLLKEDALQNKRAVNNSFSTLKNL